MVDIAAPSLLREARDGLFFKSSGPAEPYACARLGSGDSGCLGSGVGADSDDSNHDAGGNITGYGNLYGNLLVM